LERWVAQDEGRGKIGVYEEEVLVDRGESFILSWDSYAERADFHQSFLKSGRND